MEIKKRGAMARDDSGNGAGWGGMGWGGAGRGGARRAGAGRGAVRTAVCTAKNKARVLLLPSAEGRELPDTGLIMTEKLCFAEDMAPWQVGNPAHRPCRRHFLAYLKGVTNLFKDFPSIYSLWLDSQEL